MTWRAFGTRAVAHWRGGLVGCLWCWSSRGGCSGVVVGSRWGPALEGSGLGGYRRWDGHATHLVGRPTHGVSLCCFLSPFHHRKALTSLVRVEGMSGPGVHQGPARGVRGSRTSKILVKRYKNDERTIHYLCNVLFKLWRGESETRVGGRFGTAGECGLLGAVKRVKR